MPLKKKRYYEKLFKLSLDMICIANTDGHFLEINPAFEKILGHTLDELLARSFIDFVHPDDQASTITELNKLAAGIPVINFENRYRCKDGTYKVLEWSSSPVKEEGLIFAIARDLTNLKRAEEQLKESEQRLRYSLEALQASEWELNLSNHNIYRSLQHDRIFGYETLLPNWTLEMFLEHAVPEDRGDVISTLRRALETGQDWCFECQIIRRDQVVRWIRACGRENQNDKGETIGLIGIVEDITDRKRVEIELRKSRDELNMRVQERTAELRKANEFMEVILDNVPNMIFVKDAKDLRFLRFNKAGEELLGYSRQELLGKNDYDLFPKDEADFFTSKDRKVLGSNVIFEIPEEHIHTRRYGERLLRTKKIPVFDKEGRPIYLLGISEDITELNQLNQEREQTVVMLKSAERINALIQNSLDAVIACDDRGIITSWNYQAENIFGWEKKDAIGSNLVDLIIPPRFHDAYADGFAKFLDTSEGPILNRRIEMPVLRRGGVEFPVEMAISSIGDNHHHLFFAFIRDITDRKKYEQQQKDLFEIEHLARESAEKSVNMRDDFLSIAAHELKTPITPISMQLQLIERALLKGADSEITPALVQNLLKISKNSKKEIERLSRLIDELLDVSKISAGRLVLNIEEVNLSTILQNIIDRYRLPGLKARIDPEIVGQWDRMRLESVMENLITNAIKYGEGKPIEITAENKGESVMISVQDHGIGIAKEDQKKIFERFERAVSIRKFSGLGLGLYITRLVVETHRGSIKLESEPGHGSNFVIELPLHSTSLHRLKYGDKSINIRH